MARKMKDSGIEWIGEIPEGWEVTKLKYLATFPIEKNARTDSPYIGLENIESWTGKYVLSDSQYDKSQALTFSKSNILFGKLRPYLAKVFCASNDGCCSSEFCILNFSSSVNIRYFWNLLISPTFIDQVTKSTYGTKMPRANTDYIKNICAPVPPHIEQDRIALYLDVASAKIDFLLSKTHSSIEEYKKLKQAVIMQAVTKGVRGEREMKDSGVEWIGDIPKEWTCEKIKYVTSISRGLFNHRPRNDERYYNGRYPFIQTGDVANSTKYITSYSQTLNELGKSVSKEFPKGTLTMTIAANVGDVAILDFDAYFPDSVVGFVPNEGIRTLYLFYIFSAMKDEFVRTAIKSTQLNLNIDRVKETFIPVTLDMNEQLEIENYLEDKCAEIDKLIAKKEQLVKELESYKKSLIYEVVTGKREV